MKKENWVKKIEINTRFSCQLEEKLCALKSYMPIFMRIFVGTIFFFLTTMAVGQHYDTVRLGKNTIIIGAFDDDKIITEGDRFLDSGMFQEAIEKYTIVVELSPMNLEAISKRAYAYLQMDNYSQSLDDYNIALEIDSTDYVNLSSRGLVKWYLKQYKDALVDCDKSLKFNPNYAYAYFHKGICEYELGNYIKAINYYNKAIELDSTFTRAFYNRGAAKFESDDISGACSDWKIAKELGHKMADSMLKKYCK